MHESSYYGENLIFIISQPRSGSTLLQRVLAGHPDVLTSAETWLMLHPVYTHKVADIQSIYNSEWASVGVSEFIENYTDGNEEYDNALRIWAKTIYESALRKGKKEIFLDKTPRYFFIIPELYRLFPKAKFVFLLRNPMAVLSSEIHTYVKGNWPFISQIAPDLIDAPKLILEGMDLLGDDAIVIHYEEFVNNPEEYISGLCSQLDIEFNVSMLDYSKTEAPKGKLNDPVGIHQHTRPSNKGVDKWKNMKNDPQERHFAISYLRSLGKETVERYGYSFDEIEGIFSADESSLKTSKSIFPWELCLRPEKKWSFKNKIRSIMYFSIKEKGPIVGRLKAYKKILSIIAKKFK